MGGPLNNSELAQLLLAAVRAQHFERTPDALRGGAPLRWFPSLDLALIAFPRNAAPVFANVLFSREHPKGLVAAIGDEASAVRNVRFEADRRNAELVSDAWLPDADWSRLRFEALWGESPHRFVAPYPASLIKLMVAVGVARLVDQGLCAWEADDIANQCEAMLTVSSNDATAALVQQLHRHRRLDDLHHAFASRGLHTLRLDGTREDGGWTNAAGAGVGRLQMTAWDSARLLWLLDADAPPPPWPAIVSEASRARLRRWLDDQALHQILSSTALAGVPGWLSGLPARLPARWIDAAGAVDAGTKTFPPDVRTASASATLRFAHKTGTTENYASDAGIVNGLAPARRHYIVALLSSLGERYAPHPACATTWRLASLGRAIDEALAPWLEA